MSSSYVIKFEGLDELQAALKEKAKLEAVQRVVKKNGADLQRKAQNTAPVDTGNLVRSIQLDVTDGGMTAEVSATAHYGEYVERGTRYMTAKPYMKPSLTSVGNFFITDLKALTK